VPLLLREGAVGKRRKGMATGTRGRKFLKSISGPDSRPQQRRGRGVFMHAVAVFWGEKTKKKERRF